MNHMRKVMAVVAIGVLTLAACGSTVSGLPTANPGNNGSAGGGGGGGGGGLVFVEQITFTGAIPIQGSFTDNTLSSSHSCSDYAANGSTALGGWFGPQTGTVGGHDLTWSLQLGAAKFHGPGTYGVPAGLFTVLSIDDDVFGGGTTSVTVNADGSGSAQVTNAAGNTSETESGMMTWTCTGS